MSAHLGGKTWVYLSFLSALGCILNLALPVSTPTVPQGRETDWLYGLAEGRGQLAASANFRRLVVVAMHREQEYTDMQAVQSELSPMVMELAPPGMPANQKVGKL